MITVFDSSNYAQQVFFKEAYATLAAQGNILNQDEINAGKFLSLDGYFAHLEQLIGIEPKFVMIPSDESPFEINANTRTINIPSSFSKCAGVVGDNMSEIITFTIDRYFDYTDLANTHICVHWKLPAKPGEEAEEGISHIGLRDLNSVSGKLRFGWPLTNALTKNAGNITFAIRFYAEEKVTNEEGEVVLTESGEEKKQIVYILNTLPAIIPIKEGLNVSGENVVVEQGVVNLFKKFVSNSNNPAYPMPKAVTYVDDLPSQEKINERTDSLVLRAQATTSGDGYIKYNWYLKEGTGDRTDITVTPMLIESGKYFDIDHEVMEGITGSWATIPKNKQYYIADAEGGYKRVIYKMDNQKHTFTTLDGELVPEDTQLFERFTELTIRAREMEKEANGDIKYDEFGNPIIADKSEDGKAVTGLYYVTAKNVVGSESIEITNTVQDAEGNDVELKYTIPGINSTPPLTSVECYVPTPKEVVITTDLKKDVFINPNAALMVIPEADGGNPQRTYSWYRYNEDVISESEVTGEWIADEDAIPTAVASGINMSNHITQTPGWYYVNVESLLNRATKDTNSKICRVVEPTVKPQVVQMSYHKWTDAEIESGALDSAAGWNPVYKVATEDSEEFIDENGIDQATFGSIYQLKVDIQDGFDSRLKSDDMNYVWYMVKPNKDVVEVTPELMGRNSEIFEINEMNKPILNIRCTDDLNEAKSATAYFCKITNTLAEKPETFAKEDYKVMFLVH